MKKVNNKISRFLCLVLVFLLAGQTVFATTPVAKKTIQTNNEKLKSKTVAIGPVEKSTEGLMIGKTHIPSYISMNVSYVLVSDLKKVGANVAWDPGTGRTIIYDLSLPVSLNPAFDLLKSGAIGYLGRDSVYINHQEIPAIYVEEKALIPAKWIPSLLEGNKSFPTKKVGPSTGEAPVVEEVIVEQEVQDPVQDQDAVQDQNELGIVEADTEEEFLGETEEPQEEVQEEIVEEEIQEEIIEEIVPQKKGVKGINIWYNGKDYIEHNYNFAQLERGKFAYYQDKRYDKKPHIQYVGFVITQVNGIKNINAGHHKAWLKNPAYYTIPEVVVPPVIAPEGLTDLFPDTRVKGIMKYAAGGFSKGETVSVRQASSNSAYYLAGKSGNSVKVPWNSVSIQKSPVTKQEATNQQIEDYINSKNFSSKTSYFVWTDIYRQRTYVFKGSQNKWKLVRSMLSSTGKDTHLTPVGSYTLNVRVPSFGGSKYRVKNAFGFIGTTYLYHSVLYDPTGTRLLSGWGNLGNKASSGCIRLSPDDSAWLYKTMPIGTGIYIN